MSKLIILLLAISCVTESFAEDDATHMGRYLSVANQPFVYQRDLLAQTFQVRFPKSVLTVGDAIAYLLNYSGYALLTKDLLPKEVQQILTLPLPDVDRNLGPMTLENGLQVLAGDPYQLVVDPVHRLISFRLKPRYQTLLRRGTK